MSKSVMTPAPWKIDKDGYIRGGDGKTWIAQVPQEIDADNASAIVLAVNNTYGAGINPEAIPDLLKALKFVTEDPMYLELDWKMRFTILAAIEKAKL